jgi:hypothetical protein
MAILHPPPRAIWYKNAQIGTERNWSWVKGEKLLNAVQAMVYFGEDHSTLSWATHS